MNIYQINYAPVAKSVHLLFWGCNLNCRGCLKKREINDIHLDEIRYNIYDPVKTVHEAPEHFLDLEAVMRTLKGVDVARVIFMGREATVDPELPELAKALHREFRSNNILCTNGFKLIDLENIDELCVSLKAYRDDLYRDYTGESNKSVLENFVAIYHLGKKLRAESVFIPGYIDCPEIERIAKFIADVDKGIPYRVDAYILAPDSPWRVPTSEEMEAAVRVAKRYLLNVSCLTRDTKHTQHVVRIF